MIVVAIIGLLGAIAIPNYIRARAHSQWTVCINNLRQIDAATQQWALEFKKAADAIPAQSDLDSYLNRTGHADTIVCPAGGAGATFSSSYTLNRVSGVPGCKIVPTGNRAHVLLIDEDGNSQRPGN